jgi:nickel-dependent lactate racemase
MSLILQAGSPEAAISSSGKRQHLETMLESLDKDLKKILIVSPDFTRFHSQTGELTQILYDLLKNRCEIDVIPALGTHTPLTEEQRKKMYGEIPADCFNVHNWRTDTVKIGTVPASFIQEVSEGKLDFTVDSEVNRLLLEGGYDQVFSIGQVVPHEVVGMANGNKNIFVGVAGKDTIDKCHFLGAVYGMERMMGRADTPVRKVLNYMEENFLAEAPLIYIQTVLDKDKSRHMALRGLYIGTGHEPFEAAASLSQRVNLDLMAKPIKKAVVYLDPAEFKSTWLGCKAIYRTRMAIADDGELIILAPGLKEFGEDPAIDPLIRRYGYVGTSKILEAVKQDKDLQGSLSAAAHMIHGSHEGRFSVTYCPGYLTKEEIEGVNFEYGDVNEMMAKYDPEKLQDGYNTVDGEDVFFVSNPAIGLWALESKFV